MKQDIYKLLSGSPGLKGREIANKLGLDRKDVNRFLDKNRDTFKQDDNYCWFNIADSTLIEFQAGWIDVDRYEAVLSDYPDLFLSEKPIEFVLPKGCNLLLEPISRFLALLNQLDHQGIELTINLADCGKTRSFFNRAGFFDPLSDSVRVLPKRPSQSTAKIFKGGSGSLVELGAICPKTPNKALVVALRSNFVEKSSKDYETVALTVFSEFIGNVSQHSESELDGFAALQIYHPPHMRDHIQTVISDSGLGVVSTLRSTLEKYYPDLHRRFPDTGIDSDIGLVLELFSKGNITRHGKESGRGLGFKSTREQASKFDADLSIRLDTFNITLRYRDGELADPDVKRDLTRIKGTHICFDFFVD